MRNVLVISLESPDPSQIRSFSLDYGFPRTAILIATCVQQWGVHAGLTPRVLNLDLEIRRRWDATDRHSDLGTVITDVITKTVRTNNPEMICVVAPFTNVANWAVHVARVCRSASPKSVIITGGPHASFVAEDLVNPSDPIFDAVVRGPGEDKLKHILENFDNSVERFQYPGITTPTNTRDFFYRSQLNKVLPPAINYDLISRQDIGQGGTVVMAGRGCPNACQFCLESLYWRHAQIPFYKNAAGVRNEITALTKLGVPVFGCGDSLIDMRPHSSPHFDAFCHEAFEGLALNEHFSILTRINMIDRGGCHTFQKVGGKALWVGIETAGEELLTAMGKGEIFYITEFQLGKAKHHGLRVGAFFMFGFPGESHESSRKTLHLIEELFKQELIDYADISIFVPYPGLPQFHDSSKLIRHEPEWSDWSHWGRYNEPPVYDLPSLGRDEIFAYWQEAIAIKKSYDIRERERAGAKAR